MFKRACLYIEPFRSALFEIVLVSYARDNKETSLNQTLLGSQKMFG